MKNHQGAKMEKPRISPDGESLWQPNGARQRYARRLTEEVDLYRLFAVAAQVFRHRKVERGEIGPNDGISPSKEEVLDVIARSGDCPGALKCADLVQFH